MAIKKMGGVMLLAGIGAIISTLCDKFHVMTNTLSYPNPFLFGQAWWVFPIFMLAFAAMALGYLKLIEYLPKSIDRSHSVTPCNSEEFIQSSLMYALIYLLSGFASHFPILLCVLFYVSYLFRLASSHDRAFMLILSCLLALAGTLSEASLMAMDKAHYTQPDFLGVPGWLPALYMHGTYALRDGVRFLVLPSKSDKS